MTEAFKEYGADYLRLSPNPARDVVTVSYSVEAVGSSGPLQLRIRSSEGKTISSVSLSGVAGTLRMPVGNLPSGIYLVEINDPNRILKKTKMQVLR